MNRKLVTLIFLIAFSCFAQEKIEVYFDFNSADLQPKYTKILDSIFNTESAIITSISGFCDVIDTNAYNDVLSKKRALIIKDFLLRKEYQLSDTLQLHFNGKKFANTTQNAKDRRVEITYLIKENEFQKINKQDIANLKVGDSIALPKFYFYNRSGILVPKSRPVLEQLYQIMLDNPTLKIDIQGHICCQTKDIEDTSKKRAFTVYNYLIENGISKNRIKYSWYGSTKTIYKLPENNEEERNANRRVELIITSI